MGRESPAQRHQRLHQHLAQPRRAAPPRGRRQADSLRSGGLVALLAFNGLRITEALSRDVEHLTYSEGHRVLRRHVRRLVHEHRIPYIRWGHLIRFDPADIDAWIDAARRDGVR